jgi:hypothetical protein
MLTWPKLRLARKELAISATSASLGGNLRLMRLRTCSVTTFSSSLVRFIDLGLRSACKGRLSRR